MSKSMAKHIVRRIDQRDELCDWIKEHPDYQIQVNFNVPNTSDHKCVGLGVEASQLLSSAVLSALREQIEIMKRKL